MNTVEQLIQYRMSDGRVLAVTLMQSSMIPAEQAGLEAGVETLVLPAVDMIEDPDLWYVDLVTETLTQRQPMPEPVVVLTTGQAEVSALPVPCTITLGWEEYVVDDGVATITFDEPGNYRLLITGPPRYLDHTLQMEVP
jgi:hypothetical protein